MADDGGYGEFQLHQTMMLMAETGAKLIDERGRLFDLLLRLTKAASAYTADQSGASDSRCGLVQPVTVEEAEELNEAVKEAWSFITHWMPQEGE